MIKPPGSKSPGGGGGGGRITDENILRETLEIFLALWLKDKLRDLLASTGPLMKLSRLHDVMLKDVILEILPNSLEEVRQEFVSINQTDKASMRFCSKKS